MPFLRFYFRNTKIFSLYENHKSKKEKPPYKQKIN